MGKIQHKDVQLEPGGRTKAFKNSISPLGGFISLRVVEDEGRTIFTATFLFKFLQNRGSVQYKIQ